jgi:hypothetical protein
MEQSIGPQCTLYVPAPLLHSGDNELVSSTFCKNWQYICPSNQNPLFWSISICAQLFWRKCFSRSIIHFVSIMLLADGYYAQRT